MQNNLEKAPIVSVKEIQYDERKYYHFKLSCAQKDKVSPEEAHVYATELAARLFKDCECVIATHNDTKTVHSHIIINAVNPITGKKLRFNNAKYAAMKDEANLLGKEFGYTPTNFRKTSENKRTPEENHIKLKGGTSWKEDLREVVEEAKLKSTTEDEFVKHLLLYNVKITRSKTEYSFLHPEKEKPIRGKRLGENYNKENIENVITKNRHRKNGTIPSRDSGNGAGSGFTKTSHDSATGTARAEFTPFSENGQRPAQRSVSDREREMQRLNKAAEYAHRGTEYSHKGNFETNIEDGNPNRNERRQGSQSNAERIPASKPNKGGNQADCKKRDYGYSK